MGGPIGLALRRAGVAVSEGCGGIAPAVTLAGACAGGCTGVIMAKASARTVDRLPDRLRTFAVAMVASAVVAMLVYGWVPGLATTVALGFAHVFANAVSRPPLLAALANVPDDVRGAVLGLNVTSASFGWLGAAEQRGVLPVRRTGASRMRRRQGARAACRHR